MKKETIRKIAEKYNLKGDKKKFVEWFNKRFPDESDSIESYCAEWVERFNTGHPEVYMDSESRRIYEEVGKCGGFMEGKKQLDEEILEIVKKEVKKR